MGMRGARGGAFECGSRHGDVVVVSELLCDHVRVEDDVAAEDERACQGEA